MLQTHLIFHFQCPLSRYLAGGRGPDNISLLKAEAEKLEELRGNIVVSHSMASNTWALLKAQKDRSNPLNVWPMDPSSNCWVDISAYYRENNREMVESLLSWTTNYGIKVDEKTVIQTAYLCSVIQAISSKDKCVIVNNYQAY